MHGVVAHGAVVAGLRLVVARRGQRVAHGVLRRRRRHHRRGRAGRRAHRVRRRACSCARASLMYKSITSRGDLPRVWESLIGIQLISVQYIEIEKV